MGSKKRPGRPISYNSTRGGKNQMSGHTLAENIRPWTGIRVLNVLAIPSDCICTWAPHMGMWELKFVWKLCTVKGHAR